MEYRPQRMSSLHLKDFYSLSELFLVAQATYEWIEKNDLHFKASNFLTKRRLVNFIKSKTCIKTGRIYNILVQLSILKRVSPVKKHKKTIKYRGNALIKAETKINYKEYDFDIVGHRSFEESLRRYKRSYTSERDRFTSGDTYKIVDENYDIIKHMPSSFSDALDYLIKQFNMTEEDLSEKTNISVRTISELRNKEKEHIKLETVIKLCIGLNLSPIISLYMIEKSGNKFKVTLKQMAYIELIFNKEYCTLDKCNQFLLDMGFEEL